MDYGLVKHHPCLDKRTIQLKISQTNETKVQQSIMWLCNIKCFTPGFIGGRRMISLLHQLRFRINYVKQQQKSPSCQNGMTIGVTLASAMSLPTPEEKTGFVTITQLKWANFDMLKFSPKQKTSSRGSGESFKSLYLFPRASSILFRTELLKHP